MNNKVVIIILSGVVFGMFIMTPTLWLADVVVGGLICGLVAGVIGYFVMKRKEVQS